MTEILWRHRVFARSFEREMREDGAKDREKGKSCPRGFYCFVGVTGRPRGEYITAVSLFESFPFGGRAILALLAAL